MNAKQIEAARKIVKADDDWVAKKITWPDACDQYWAALGDTTVTEICRAYLSSLSDAGWRTMESAPKDRSILLGAPDWSKTYEGFWEEWQGRTLRERWKLAINGTTAHPTHWQPLPSSPSKEKETP